MLHILEAMWNKYRAYMEDARELLGKSSFDKEDKFWLRLINSNLHLKCLAHFEDDIKYLVNPGSSSVPYLSIIPKAWKMKTKLELLIQVQGNELKCYIHSNDRSSISQLIAISGESFKDLKIELKKLTKKDTGTVRFSK